MNRLTKQTVFKKALLEMCFFGVVIITSSAMLSSMTPTYKTKRFTAGGSADLALVSVPVPVDPMMEGKKVEYTVRCTMKNGALECLEAN